MTKKFNEKTQKTEAHKVHYHKKMAKVMKRIRTIRRLKTLQRHAAHKKFHVGGKGKCNEEFCSKKFQKCSHLLITPRCMSRCKKKCCKAGKCTTFYYRKLWEKATGKVIKKIPSSRQLLKPSKPLGKKLLGRRRAFGLKHRKSKIFRHKKTLGVTFRRRRAVSVKHMKKVHKMVHKKKKPAVKKPKKTKKAPKKHLGKFSEKLHKVNKAYKKK